MDIKKMIKRNYIIKQPEINIKINTKIDYSFIKKGEKAHKILQANIKKYLEQENKLSQVIIEDSNLDVVDLINGIIVECGHTEAGKLFDTFNVVFSGIENTRQFWVLQFFDEIDKISSCYKFMKSETYQEI
jgi:ATP-dependent protease HslVU (ClpYQ) ATPase subunit